MPWPMFIAYAFLFATPLLVLTYIILGLPFVVLSKQMDKPFDIDGGVLDSTGRGSVDLQSEVGGMAS